VTPSVIVTGYARCGHPSGSSSAPRRRIRKYGTAIIIIDELGLCRGTVRVDIAVVNGVLKGYEIKGDQDTLRRLASQAATYNRIFDTMTSQTTYLNAWQNGTVC
jgi:hypothetical protein